MPLPSPGKVLAALHEAASLHILPRFRKLGEGEVRSKGGQGNLVTVADEDAERFLTPLLRDLVPGSYVVGEEGVAADLSVLEALGREDWIWLVDPVDGTANFAAGTPVFCSMLALLHRGETVLACIHRPVDGDSMLAERGSGAILIDFAGRDRKAITPQIATDDLSRLVAALYNKDLAPLKGKFARISRSGCAGSDYWNAVEGHYHVLAFRTLKPWDHAPGDLIFREAGGAVRMLSGSPYEPALPNQRGILAASNEDLWRQIAGFARQLQL